jgi:hypothetical protein
MGTFISNLHVRRAECQAVVEALQSLGATPAYLGDEPGGAWLNVFPEAGEQNLPALQEIAQGLSRILRRPAIAFLVHDSDVLQYSLADGGEVLDSYDSAPGYFEGKKREPEGGNVTVLKRYCLAGTSIEQLLRLLHQRGSAAARSNASTAADSQTVREAVLKTLRDSYPKMAAQRPDLPSLETLLALANKRFSDRTGGDPAAFAPNSFVFADDMLRELAGYLGIDQRRALDSYRYLQSGEGTMASLLLVEADSVGPVNFNP